MLITRFVLKLTLALSLICVLVIALPLAINKQLKRPILAYVGYYYSYSVIHIVDVERAVSLEVTSTAQEFCLLDDGQKIVYIGNLNPGTGEWNIELFDLNTQLTHIILPAQPSTSYLSPPACSPDGHWIAFSTSEGISIIDQTGENLRLVVPIAGAHNPGWSLDSSRLIFSNGLNPDTNTLIFYEVNLDGTNMQETTSTSRANLFIARPYSLFVDNADIWLRDSATDQLTQLTFTPAAEELPAWSPDSTQIAFVTHGFPPGCQLWLINTDGSNPHTLSSPSLTRCRDLEWSPDGQQIALAGEDDRWPDVGYPVFVSDNIFVVNTDGSGFRQIVQSEPATEHFRTGYNQLRWLP